MLLHHLTHRKLWRSFHRSWSCNFNLGHLVTPSWKRTSHCISPFLDFSVCKSSIPVVSVSHVAIVKWIPTNRSTPWSGWRVLERWLNHCCRNCLNFEWAMSRWSFGPKMKLIVGNWTNCDESFQTCSKLTAFVTGDNLSQDNSDTNSHEKFFQ